MAYGFYDIDAPENRPPHPPIPIAVLLIVEEAIRVAWFRLRSRNRDDFNITTATENRVTHELHEVLYDEVFNKGLVDGFDRELFATIARAPTVRNFDKSHLDKMPDMRVELIGRPRYVRMSQDGLFIEC